MEAYLVYYFTVLFLSLSGLMICFRGSCFYCHALKLLKDLKVKSHGDFWNLYVDVSNARPVMLDIQDWTFDDAIEFISKKNRFLGALLSCPFCLSWHFSFWGTIFTLIMAYLLYGQTFPLWVIFLTFIQTPFISNYLLSKV